VTFLEERKMMTDLLKVALLGLALGACAGDKDGTDSGLDTDGTDTDGTTPPACALSCADYCTSYLTACEADPNNTYADQADCETKCAGFTCGADTDTTGDTLGCRIYHAGVANTDAASAATHCPHAGETPTDQCVDM
jgi:hypothetical protein